MNQRSMSVAKIALLLFPFGAGAMSVNVFFASLIGSWVGLPVLSATWSMILGSAIGGPTTWIFSRHIRALMEQANGID
ncbi:hypothetical protein SAMN04488092_107135 [Thalassovita taeanensis]|uniref:NnrT protein n=2 Tax=Thalassovita taeanensis TaxID=657014 RepID=A0A1H9GEC0_9RHOB|nr:NnrT protein [Thalassovita taeanensis]SEQ48128.1 hypothetical protein SAMN04488092_107135 [Thalassovita taeanensis]